MAREKTEKLRQSILAKAFSGELIEIEAEIARREGRDYEAAEVLLERIKVEKKEKARSNDIIFISSNLIFSSFWKGLPLRGR